MSDIGDLVVTVMALDGIEVNSWIKKRTRKLNHLRVCAWGSQPNCIPYDDRIGFGTRRENGACNALLLPALVMASSPSKLSSP
jgi:hypothetical protein